MLEKIVAQKKREVQRRREVRPLAGLVAAVGDLPPPRDLAGALRHPGEVSLIAEVKRASPSKGWLRKGLKPGELVRLYSRAGARAISVLTDNAFFYGHRFFLPLLRRETQLPLLMKDFIVDPYQIYEARWLGADAVLLIASILDDGKLRSFQHLAGELGLSCLVEVHTSAELRRALDSGARMVGINNRNLRTFTVDLATTFRLREEISDPEVVVVSESGIASRREMLALLEHRVDAALVGEALVTAPDPEQKVKELLGSA